MQDFGELDKLESMTSLVELSLVSNVVSIQDFLNGLSICLLAPIRYISKTRNGGDRELVDKVLDYKLTGCETKPHTGQD